MYRKRGLHSAPLFNLEKISDHPLVVGENLNDQPSGNLASPKMIIDPPLKTESQERKKPIRKISLPINYKPGIWSDRSHSGGLNNINHFDRSSSIARSDPSSPCAKQEKISNQGQNKLGRQSGGGGGVTCSTSNTPINYLTSIMRTDMLKIDGADAHYFLVQHVIGE